MTSGTAHRGARPFLDHFLHGVRRILKRSRGTLFLDVGKPFDASRHVAVESMESGVVAHCVGVGALLEGGVLRRAEVVLQPAGDGGAAEARSALAKGLSELADDAECEATRAGIFVRCSDALPGS